MTTMGFSGRAQMPRVSYATALDWFVILCFGFVFAVMIEYAVINFIDKLTSDIKKLLEAKGLNKKKVGNLSQIIPLSFLWFMMSFHLLQRQSQAEPIYQEVISNSTVSTPPSPPPPPPPPPETTPETTEHVQEAAITTTTTEEITSSPGELSDQRDWDAIEIYGGSLQQNRGF